MLLIRRGLPGLAVLIVAVLLAPLSALAGPPFLTDDPQPTDTGHWEVYNFVDGERGGDHALNGEAGVDLNYGLAKDLQLTAVFPLAFASPNGFSSRGLHGGGGVIELAAKYEFLHQSDGSWMPDVAIFPRAFVPTDSRFGPPNTNLLLPVWAQKDFGPWQVFGGGGYQINPGADQRNFWEGGIAVNRTISKRLTLGAEVFGQTKDTSAGGGYTAVNFAGTYKLIRHWSLLASAGPTWEQGGGHGGVLYLALKADY